MRTSIRTLAVAAALGLTLTGCTTHRTQEADFPFTGTTLDVITSNTAMPVTVSGGNGHGVHVAVTTTSAGKSATEPGWHLDGTELHLGSPCDKGYVGYCEGSYHVTVPAGTTVRVDGRQVAVR